MPDLQFKATINGRKISRNAKPHQRLLDFIRDDLNLTGNKEGCGAGECGTCSVFVDGVLMKSCLMPVAKAQGATIETVEALAKTGELSVLQKAFHKAGASQCGYCIPGMVMAATAALRTNPFADREEIKERLGGNICRCTGYQKIFDAVELARDVQNGRCRRPRCWRTKPEDGDFIGKNVRRIDAPSKVSGRLKYAGDMTMPGMLHVQVLRSPHAACAHRVDRYLRSRGDGGRRGRHHLRRCAGRGRLRRVRQRPADHGARQSALRRRGGCGGRRRRPAHRQARAVADQGRVRAAAGRFRSRRGHAAGAPVLHDYAPDNVTKHIPIRVGDVEKGFAESDLVVEETYSTQPIEHAYLEPEAGLAYVDHDGVVTIVSPDQNITHHRHMLARIIAKPISKVRFIMSPVGGGFGGKEDMIYQGMLALLAMKTQRPVRLVFTREESIISTAKRHPSRTMLAHGTDARRPHPRVANEDDLRRRRLRPVDRRRHAQGGDPGGRALCHSRMCRSTPTGSTRTTRHPAPSVPSEPCRRRLRRNRISISAPSGLASIRSRSAASMRCAMARVTHTKAKLASVSLTRALDALEKASGWEAGAPTHVATRGAISAGDDIRPPCALGARFAAAEKQEAAE